MHSEAMQPKILYFWGLKIGINPNSTWPEIEEMVKNIRENTDHYFKQKIIKNDLATTVSQEKIGEHELIIKRINAQNLFTIIRRFFCFSRIKRNWKFAHILTYHHIDTFTPIMMVDKKVLGLSYINYLYMTKIDGVEAIAYFEKQSDKAQWQPIADKIIALIKKLNALGLRHRDLNLSNMIISEDKVFLIDLDAMKQEKRVHAKFCKKEIDKFIENIEHLKQKNSELYHYFYHELESR